MFRIFRDISDKLPFLVTVPVKESRQLSINRMLEDQPGFDMGNLLPVGKSFHRQLTQMFRIPGPDMNEKIRGPGHVIQLVHFRSIQRMGSELFHILV